MSVSELLLGVQSSKHLFALKQNFAAYQFLLRQIAECDSEIEALLSKLAEQKPLPAAPLPEARSKRSPKRAPAFDIRSPLHRLTGGADLSHIDSIGRMPRYKSLPRSGPTCAVGPPKNTLLPGLP